MIPRVREMNKKAGVCYVVDDDGLELPVIDITHPAFESNFSPSELAAISEVTLRGMQKLQRIPRFVRKWLTRGSILTRDQAKPFVGGVTTYLMKLGRRILVADMPVQ
jgi:hypothetical protein